MTTQPFPAAVPAACHYLPPRFCGSRLPPTTRSTAPPTCHLRAVDTCHYCLVSFMPDFPPRVRIYLLLRAATSSSRYHHAFPLRGCVFLFWFRVLCGLLPTALAPYRLFPLRCLAYLTGYGTVHSLTCLSTTTHCHYIILLCPCCLQCLFVAAAHCSPHAYCVVV